MGRGFGKMIDVHDFDRKVIDRRNCLQTLRKLLTTDGSDWNGDRWFIRDMGVKVKVRREYGDISEVKVVYVDDRKHDIEYEVFVTFKPSRRYYFDRKRSGVEDK